MENATRDNASEQFHWFLDNRDFLYKTYGHVFLAIKNKEVIGVYNSRLEGLLETEKKEKIGTFIIHECCTREYEKEHMPTLASMFTVID